MAVRNNYLPGGAVAGRQSEASRREIIFSFASVLLVSALISGITLSIMRGMA